MRKFLPILATTGLVLLGWASLVTATTLFGGVQHAEYEAPASRYNRTFGTQLQNFQYMPDRSGLGAGTYAGVGMVDPNFNAQPQRKVDWFKIPAWMAGRWTKKGDMTLNVTDFRTGRSSNMQQWTEDELTVTWGHQLDREGNIWEANFVPSERDATSNSKFVRFLLVECHCESTMPQQVITRMHYIVTESAGWAQAVDQFQQESLNDYTPISEGELQNYSSTRVFTYEGAATRNGITVSRFTRVEPFHPIAMLDGVDLRRSLSSYLHEHQLDHLIPGEASVVNGIPVVPAPGSVPEPAGMSAQSEEVKGLPVVPEP